MKNIFYKYNANPLIIAAYDDNESIAETSHSDGADQDEAEGGKQCPLCQEHFRSQDRLDEHALSVHSINAEGLARLQSLINGSHWLANKQNKENNPQDEESCRPTSTDKGTLYISVCITDLKASHSLFEYLIFLLR